MTVPRAIPGALCASFSTLSWPLHGDNPPLHFLSLEELQPIRTSNNILSSSVHLDFTSFLQDISGNTESILPSHEMDPEQRHFGLIALGLILLGHGFTDECHNLITPLSWPEDIHFAHYPSLFHQASASAQAYASYVHSLVHRREAFHRGEFGMIGFANADYWSNAALRSVGASELPHQQLYACVKDLCEKSLSNSSVAAWCREHGMFQPNPSEQFDNRAIHRLCAQVLRRLAASDAVLTSDDHGLKDFAERIVESEIRILLYHSLEKAGFDVGSSSKILDSATEKRPKLEYSGSPPKRETCLVGRVVNEEVALSAARKLSSAHMDLFQSEGSVVLRQAAPLDDPMSAAAGISCRLLGTPACRLLVNSDVPEEFDRIVEVVLYDTDLAVADMMVRRPGQGDVDRESAFVFVPAEIADSKAFYVDRLYGLRGETPTSVIQWSKGTIF